METLILGIMSVFYLFSPIETEKPPPPQGSGKLAFLVLCLFAFWIIVLGAV